MNGVSSEGIFRLAGEQAEIHRVKELLNTKKFDINSTRDIHAIASLIKVKKLKKIFIFLKMNPFE